MSSPSPQPSIPRKRWSTRRKTLLILLVLAVLWGGFEIIWRVTGEPAPVIDYHSRVYEHAASFQPEGENGWEALIEVIYLHDAIVSEAMSLTFEEPAKEVIPFNLNYLDFGAFREKPFVPELFPREMLMLKRLDEDRVFEQMDEALDKPRMLRPPSSGGMLAGVRLSGLSKFQAMARTRVGSLYLAALRGEWEAAVRHYEYMLALAHACARQPFLIDRLVGLAIASLAYFELQHLLVEKHPEEATCRSLLAAMDRRLNWPPWELALETERLSQLDILQNVFTDDGHGDGRLDSGKLNTILGMTGTVPAMSGGVIGNIASLYRAGRKETTEKHKEYFDQLIAESQLSYPDRVASDFDAAVYLDTLTFRLFLLRTLDAGHDQALLQQDVVTVIERATRIMIHLEIHRHRSGEYPETLNELIGDVNPEHLIDPLNGGPIAYRLLHDEANGLPYVLYSLGIDGIDQHAETEITDVLYDFHFWGFKEENADGLLNKPREFRREYEQ